MEKIRLQKMVIFLLSLQIITQIYHFFVIRMNQCIRNFTCIPYGFYLGAQLDAAMFRGGLQPCLYVELNSRMDA